MIRIRTNSTAVFLDKLSLNPAKNLDRMLMLHAEQTHAQGI